MADERLLKEKYARLYEEHKKREQLVDATAGDILALLYDHGITIGEAERIFDSIRDEIRAAINYFGNLVEALSGTVRTKRVTRVVFRDL